MPKAETFSFLTNVLHSPIHILLTCNKNTFTTSLMSSTNYLPPSTNFYTIFHQSTMVLLCFFVFKAHQSYHLVGFHATGINFSSIVFYNLLYQALSLTWLNVSGSQLSKLSSSRLILRFILLRPISLLKNATMSEFIS